MNETELSEQGYVYGGTTKKWGGGVYYYRWICADCKEVMVMDMAHNRMCPDCPTEMNRTGRVETHFVKSKANKTTIPVTVDNKEKKSILKQRKEGLI